MSTIVSEQEAFSCAGDHHLGLPHSGTHSRYYGKRDHAGQSGRLCRHAAAGKRRHRGVSQFCAYRCAQNEMSLECAIMANKERIYGAILAL